MVGTTTLLFSFLAILATAQNADSSQTLNTVASTGGIPPSSTGPVTIALVTTLTSDGQPTVQTTGFTTIYPLFTNSSTSISGQIGSTTPSSSLSSQTITVNNSSVSNTVLSSSSDSTGLSATPGESASSSFSTLVSSANTSSSNTGFATTSSSINIGETSSSTIGSLTNTSLVVIPTDGSTSASLSLPPGESSSVSSSVSVSDSASRSDTTPTGSSAITPTDSLTTTPTGSSATPGQPTTTPPPATTTTSYSDEEISSYLSMTSWDNDEVTSTITTDTSISASSTSNSEWKSNFWLHTTIDNKPTDLPVVHCGCVCKDNCDDDDDDDDWPALWIIYFNVPKTPKIQISLPKLPDFHLGGCMEIKVPIINIKIPLGNCPPVSDNGQHGHSDPDDPDNKNKEPDDPDDPEQSQTPSQSASSGQESSTSASSSSSSCSGAVVTDYLTHISCPTTGASATQCATAIETGTRSGCSLTGTASVTVSASAAACAKQSWPTSFSAGVGYTQSGEYEYGTYMPPGIFGSQTVSFSSMTVSASSGLTGPTTGGSPTTFSTVPSSSGTLGESATPSNSSGTATPTPSDSGTPSATGGQSTPSEYLDCEDNKSQWWVDPETMQKGISDFCEEASQATGWDDGEGRVDGHKRIERVYNNDTDQQVVLLVSSTNSDLDNGFKQINKDDCNSTMTKIFDKCPPGQDIPGIDWRHGGENRDGSGLSWIIVTDRPKYHPGNCTFVVEEHVFDGPDDTSEHHWETRTSISDAEEGVITLMGDWDDLYNAPYKEDTDRGDNQVPGLYSELNINAGLNDANEKVFHFTVGNYQFSSEGLGGDGVPKCEAGDWDESNSYRNTSCWVYC